MRSLSIFFISVVIGLSACQSQEVETRSRQSQGAKRSQAPVTDKSITTSSAPSKSTSHPIFQTILAELQNNTTIPLSLPTYIPEYDQPNSLYALIEKTTASEYTILLAFTQDCTGGTACRLGGVSGKKISSQDSKLNGQEVALVNNITGYFTDAVCGANCSDSTLSWVQNDIYYTVALQGGKLENLVKMANSAIAPNTTVKSSSTPVTKEFLISSAGIGVARLGMTLGELKQILGEDAEFRIESSFMVDINAIAVIQNGSTQYYILYPVGTTLTDSEPITYLMTKNPDYRTQEEIGVGTTLQQAETIYGEATLFFNTSNESREYVSFANQKSQNIRFRPSINDVGFAGIYGSDLEEYNETQDFHSSAKIDSIEVFCPPQNCASN